MRERPILFSAPMVRALLSGSKTQTRRVLKGVNAPSTSIDCDERGVAEISTLYGDGPGYDVHEAVTRKTCPYGQPGDRLWVRETWAAFDADWLHPGKPHDLKDGPWPNIGYAADKDLPAGAARPSIHMPRWASRINLEITGVRVERLQDISASDAWAEGIPHSPDVNPIHEYQALWESLNGAGSWDANPWVWVVEFKTGMDAA